MKNYPNKTTIFFYFFSMLFLGSILYNTVQLIVLKQNPMMDTAQVQTVVDTLLQFIIYLILVLGIGVLMRQFFKDDFHSFMNSPLKNILYGAGGLFMMYGLIFVYSIIIMIFNYQPETPENQQAIQDTFFTYPLLMLPVLTLAAPFVEETIFRGIIFRTINKFNTIIAFIMSSCLFGAIHVMTALLMSHDIRDLIDGIPYFISGFALTFIYYKTKNIFVPMITHFLYNTAATVMMFVAYLIEDYLPEELFTSSVHMILQLLNLR